MNLLSDLATAAANTPPPKPKPNLYQQIWDAAPTHDDLWKIEASLRWCGWKKDRATQLTVRYYYDNAYADISVYQVGLLEAFLDYHRPRDTKHLDTITVDVSWEDPQHPEDDYDPSDYRLETTSHETYWPLGNHESDAVVIAFPDTPPEVLPA